MEDDKKTQDKAVPETTKPKPEFTEENHAHSGLTNPFRGRFSRRFSRHTL